ncbi:MAG: right-handed parallel beta-helix repeat-containing protein [Thermofilaceae archaeon]
MSGEAWIPAFDGKGRYLGHLRDADAADLLLQASRGKGYTRVPASYIVYREGDVYKAKSGEAGRVEFEDTDAGAVINQAVSASPRGGVVFVGAGDYAVSTPITLKPGVTLQGEGSDIWGTRGTTLWKAFDGGFLIDCDPSVQTERAVVRGFCMRPLGGKSGGGVRFQAARHSRLEDCVLLYFQGNGVEISPVEGKATENVSVKKCYLFANKGHGIVVSASDNIVEETVVDSYTAATGSYALLIQAGSTLVRNCHLVTQGVSKPSTLVAALISSAASYCRFTGNFVDNTHQGLIVEGSWNTITGNFFYFSRRELLVIKGHRNAVVGNAFYDSSREAAGYTDILIDGGTGNTIVGNTFKRASANTVAAIKEAGAADWNVIAHNSFDTGYASGAVIASGANTVTRGNINFRTEASGTATIPAGSTYADVAHGLSITPKPERIRVTPLDNLGNRSFWVSSVTSTSFRINISSSDTVGHSFGWSYE